MKSVWKDFGAADGDDVGAVAVGFFGADAGDGVECRDCCRACDDEVVKDVVAEDDEGGFAGFCSFGFSPGAKISFEGFLFGSVGGGGLFTFGFERGFGGLRARLVAGIFV